MLFPEIPEKLCICSQKHRFFFFLHHQFQLSYVSKYKDSHGNAMHSSFVLKKGEKTYFNAFASIEVTRMNTKLSVSQRNFAFACKRIEFPWETLCALAREVFPLSKSKTSLREHKIFAMQMQSFLWERNVFPTKN